MRTYGHYCGLAKALDIIGDRWTLLVVRELLSRGACRYTDLLHGLPGIATNLLADRMRDLEKHDVVRREDAPPPVATTLFHLTERGRQLEPAIRSLGAWGGPLLAEAPRGDACRAHWFYLPVTEWLTDASPKAPPVVVEIRTGKDAAAIHVGGGAVRVLAGAPANPNLALAGDHRHILRVLLGTMTVAQARAAGLKITGNAAVLRRLRSRAPSASRATA